MKQTAVEWLVEHLNLDETSPNYNKLIIQQAKEMEKEQIVDFAYVIADDLACGVFRDKKSMEKRYDEYLTYAKEDDDIQ